MPPTRPRAKRARCGSHPLGNFTSLPKSNRRSVWIRLPYARRTYPQPYPDLRSSAALCTSCRGRLMQQISCPPLTGNAIIHLAEAACQPPVEKSTEGNSTRIFLSREIHSSPIMGTGQAPLRTPDSPRPWSREDCYPHFYPQVEHPSFGRRRPNSVHNRDGDIFVNNHRRDDPKRRPYLGPPA